MPNKQHNVDLSEDERAELESFVSSDIHRAEDITRARILLKADDGATDFNISRALDCGQSTSYRARKRYADRGLAVRTTTTATATVPLPSKAIRSARSVVARQPVPPTSSLPPFVGRSLHAEGASVLSVRLHPLRRPLTGGRDWFSRHASWSASMSSRSLNRT